MPEATNGKENNASPEGSAAASTGDQGNATVKPATDEIESLKVQMAKLLRHKEELEADLHKARKRNDDEVRKAKEAGDFAKLLDVERDRAATLEARLKEIEGDASLGRTARERAAADVEKAKADKTLPAYVRKAIEVASALDAAEILAEYRASQKPTPPAATPLGAAPANDGGPKTLANMTPQEILNTTPDRLDELMGRKKNGQGLWSAFFPKG